LALEARSEKKQEEEKASSSISSGTEDNLLSVVDIVGSPEAVEVVLSTSPATEAMEVDSSNETVPSMEQSLAVPATSPEHRGTISPVRYPSPVKKRVPSEKYKKAKTTKKTSSSQE
jgi:hypothetical protein